ncbi:hypothetical protein KBB08_00855 [Candidatus Gracilibacteria bacterium]|nr:hypothetical protein [Candidatus Gracilibacteria bacterium]
MIFQRTSRSALGVIAAIVVSCATVLGVVPAHAQFPDIGNSVSQAAGAVGSAAAAVTSGAQSSPAANRPAAATTTSAAAAVSSGAASAAGDSNATNPYARLGSDGYDTRPAAPPSFTVPTFGSIEAYITLLINFLLDFLALGILIMLIYGGYLYVTAMGDSGKQKKSRGIMTSAIIGFFLVIVSFAIVATIIAATRPGANECVNTQQGVCLNSNGTGLKFGIGTGVGTLLGSIF